MMKTLVKRGLLGFPLGIALGYVITIVLSLFFAQGYYSPCVPALVETTGSIIGAVVLQALLSGILGSTFAAASCIWEMHDWGIVGQTGIYFLVTAFALFPIAYFTHWMPHTLAGFLGYAAIFVAIFVVMWIIQYAIWKSKLKNINRKMDGHQET